VILSLGSRPSHLIYGLSDPQCEEMVADRISWRAFVGLGWQDAVPDETTLVRFRQRLREYGLHEKLPGLVNVQLEQKGLILKTCTLVDATLLQAARRAPPWREEGETRDGGKSGGRADVHRVEKSPAEFPPDGSSRAQKSTGCKTAEETGLDADADFTVRNGRSHYGYKAHVAVDEKHTLIRHATMTSARVQDCCEFLNLVRGDEQRVMADKAYWSRKHSRWCEQHGVANGIMRKAQRGEKLPEPVLRANRLLSSVRCKIEKIFGWWKRSASYRRVRYVGAEASRLELEFKCISWNLKRLVSIAAT